MKREGKISPEQAQALRQRAKLYASVFGTYDGKRVLRMLLDEFDGPALFSNDASIAAYRLGKRDVVRHMMTMAELKIEDVPNDKPVLTVGEDKKEAPQAEQQTGQQSSGIGAAPQSTGDQQDAKQDDDKPERTTDNE